MSKEITAQDIINLKIKLVKTILPRLKKLKKQSIKKGFSSDEFDNAVRQLIYSDL